MRPADVTKRCINPRTSVQRFNESEEKGVLNWDTRREQEDGREGRKRSRYKKDCLDSL